ncbi:response regulator transcription factor, partial [Roseovarius sp. ZX-A-9]|uniref:response regulator transcription factor n=1 Tax=Roseovarius sp. ZX-A-9 TaxID=3014783 RepID=UPI00232EA4FC
LGALRHIRWVIFKCHNRVSFERSLTLTVTDTPLSTENLHAASTLTRYVVERAQVLREGIDAAKPDIRRLQSLSSHQMEILHWVSQGKTNREIAVIVGKSRSTIDYHLEEIRRKMGVLTRAQAAVIFTRAKLNGALSQSNRHRRTCSSCCQTNAKVEHSQKADLSH